MVKKKLAAVSLRKTAVAPLGESLTTMFVNQPADNNGHAEECVLANNPPPTPGTSADEAAADAGSKSHETTTSPYVYGPVAFDCGPGLTTYWVPKHFLRSTNWSATDAGGTICLPGVSAATGHTLVHYLYTGTYHALEAKGKAAASPAHIKFEQALLTFVLASAYKLQDLEILAKQRIETYGSRMALVEILDTATKEFSKMASSWFHKYLQARAKEQFDLDYTFFTSTAFVESMGEGTLDRFMMSHLLQIFSKKLTHALQCRNSHSIGKEKPDAVLDEIEGAPVNTHHCPCYHGGHQTGMCIANDEQSFEFENASCGDVDDVIYLGNSSISNCAFPESPTKEIPYPEVGEERLKNEEEERLAKEEKERLAKEAEDARLAQEAEEEAERKKKEEEEAAAAAAAVSAAADLSWAELAAPANDDWGSFTATATTGKKKKGKKGKAAEPPPPPPAPAEPAPAFDDIKLDDVNLDDGAPKIDMNFGDSGAGKSGSGFELPSLGGWSAGWDASTKPADTWGFDDTSKTANDGGENQWDSAAKKKKDSSGFEFDFDAFKGGAEPAPPAEEKPVADDGWGSAALTTKSKKKGKKGVLIEEPAPEPELTPAPEPEKKDEEDPWSFKFDGATDNKKKKKGKKGALEELSSPPPEPEPLAEPEPEPVPEPVKEEDPWASSGAPIGKKSKKGKKGKEEPKVEEPPPPAEPEPEPVPEPEPEPVVPEPEPELAKEEPAVDPFAGLSKSQKKKLQQQMKLDAKAKEEEDAKRQAEEDAAELVRREEEAEAERIRLEEEEAEKKRIEEEEAAAAAAESEKKKEDPMDSWGGAAPATTKKKKKKGAKEEPRVEESPLSPPELEPLIEPEPVPPAEDKPADDWDTWGAAAAPIRKSKKGKKGAAVIVPDPEPIVEPEPVAEPEPEPVPEAEPTEEEKNEGGDWGFSSIWGGKKKKKKGDKSAEPEPEFAEPLAIEDSVQEPDALEKEQEHEPKPESILEESMPETSSMLCSRRSLHLEGDRWKSCERCCAMLKEIAIRLAKEDKTALHGE